MKVYGGGGFLFGLLSPMLALFMTTLGTKSSIQSEERVLEEAEQDAQRMVNMGYRVVASDWYEIPMLRIGYQRVEYIRAPRADSAS